MATIPRDQDNGHGNDYRTLSLTEHERNLSYRLVSAMRKAALPSIRWWRISAAERNTKHQTPSSREGPNLKHQTPKTDARANGAQVGF